MTQSRLAPDEKATGRTCQQCTVPPCLHRGLTFVRWGAFILLAGYLLFAHGCHPGDHDNELFAWARKALPQQKCTP